MGELTGKFTAMALGRIFVLGLSLATVAIMTRHLGTEGYGYYRTIIAVMTLSMIIADAGLGSIFVREFSSRADDQGRLLSSAVALRIALAFPILLIGAAVCDTILDREASTLILLLAVIGYLSYSIHTLLFTVFQQRLRQRGAIVAEILGGTLLLATVVLLTFMAADFIWFVVALGASYVVTLAMTILSLKELIRFEWQVNGHEMRTLLREMLSIAWPATLLVVYMRADSVLLAALSDAKQVGVYGVPIKIFDAGMGVALLFVGMVSPIIARYAKQDPTAQAQTLNASVKWTLYVGVAIVIGAWHLSELALWLLAGEAFAAEGAPILFLLAVVLLLHTLALICRETVVANNQQHRLTRIYAIAFGVATLLYIGLIPAYGGLGAAWAVALAEVCVVIQLLVALHSLNCSVDLKSAALPAAAGTGAILLSETARSAMELNPLVASCIALMLYLLIVTFATDRASMTLLRPTDKPA